MKEISRLINTFSAPKEIAGCELTFTESEARIIRDSLCVMKSVIDSLTKAICKPQMKEAEITQIKNESPKEDHFSRFADVMITTLEEKYKTIIVKE